MKKFTLFLLLFVVNVLAVKAQNTNEQLLASARKSYHEGQMQTTLACYAAVDSVVPLANYTDLWNYYVSSVIMRDSARCKDLLFRLVQSNGLGKDGPEFFFFKNWKIQSVPYWHEVDSLLDVVQSQKCRPFIDSLEIMVQADQAIRYEDLSQEETWKRMSVIDSTNTAKLVSLIEQYGFPTWDLVGRRASQNAWLIAQHSQTILPWFLKRYRIEVRNNNADADCLALMEDRFRTQEGLPQLYGSQLFGSSGFFPIANVDEVDDRRFSMGLGPINEYAKGFDLDSVVVAAHFYDYHYYYVNLGKALENILNGDYAKTIQFLHPGSLHYPFPWDLKLLCDAYLSEKDTLNAVATARRMVLCGSRLDEDNLLSGFLRDSVAKDYETLVEEYRLQLDCKANVLFDSTQSFDEIRNLLDTKRFPRYNVDAWNNVIPSIIRKHAGQVSESDYLEFFDWLYGQVAVGNYHLFDCAELYDEVYCRLFGRSYFGQKAFDEEVPLFEPENVEQRRAEILLPPLEVCKRLDH